MFPSNFAHAHLHFDIPTASKGGGGGGGGGGLYTPALDYVYSWSKAIAEETSFLTLALAPIHALRLVETDGSQAEAENNGKAMFCVPPSKAFMGEGLA